MTRIWRNWDSDTLLVYIQNGTVFLKNSLVFPWNVKCGTIYDLATMLLIIYAQKKWKHLSTQELVRKYWEQHYSDSQKVEKTQVFVSGWMNKENVLYPYNRVVFSHEKEWSACICCSKDDPWKRYSKCKKPDAEDRVSYGSTYLKYPEQATLKRQTSRWVVVTDEGNVGWLPVGTGFLLGVMQLS